VEIDSLALHLKLERGQLFSGLTLETGRWKAILWPYTRNWSVESYSLALQSKLERGKLFSGLHSKLEGGQPFSGLKLKTEAWRAILCLTLEFGVWPAILWPYIRFWSVDSYSLISHSKLEGGHLFYNLKIETGLSKVIL
jgi:hypothetical protein